MTILPSTVTIEDIARVLRAEFGVNIASTSVLSVGNDPYASVYEIGATDGTCYFLKIKYDYLDETSLLVPHALREVGIKNVLAPLPSRTGKPACAVSGANFMLYPLISGKNAMTAGLSDDQWRRFGSTLQAVHSNQLGDWLGGRLPVETFSLPSAEQLHKVLTFAETAHFEDGAKWRLAAFLREVSGEIRQMLARAEKLRTHLSAKTFDFVLCHADIHAANILVAEGGDIYLIDWDAPKLAPRERDLLFVIGCKIARTVQPREERLFFEGYGPVDIDRDLLIYYRYERIFEDIAVGGEFVFFNSTATDQQREEEVDMVFGQFEPGGIVETAEDVTLHG